MNKIIIACDSFKGSLSSKEANSAIKEGIMDSFNDCCFKCITMADGGEGTLEAIMDSAEGVVINYKGVNHYNLPVDSFYYYSEQLATVYVDIASVCGLNLVDKEVRRIMEANSYGFGCLIKESLGLKPKRIVICLGGSGCSDGGIGMLFAMGAKFYNQVEEEIVPKTKSLDLINRVDLSLVFDLLKGVEIVVACDVNNRYCGNDSASLVYARQKGASETEILLLEDYLTSLNEIYKRDFNTDLANVERTGSAGGVSGALYLLGAKLVNGIDLMLKITNFKEELKDCDLVITGEGSIDAQTIYGKTISGIAKLCKEENIRVIAIGGRIKDADNLYEIGVSEMHSIMNDGISLEESIQNAYKLLRDKAYSVGKSLTFK